MKLSLKLCALLIAVATAPTLLAPNQLGKRRRYTRNHCRKQPATAMVNTSAVPAELTMTAVQLTKENARLRAQASQLLQNGQISQTEYAALDKTAKERDQTIALYTQAVRTQEWMNAEMHRSNLNNSLYDTRQAHQRYLTHVVASTANKPISATPVLLVAHANNKTDK